MLCSATVKVRRCRSSGCCSLGEGVKGERVNAEVVGNGDALGQEAEEDVPAGFDVGAGAAG
jgi:hypothetical protein